jgi:XTP/dITP diphosphohydrolase
LSARGARFVCVAALATPEGAVDIARGECAGAILEAPHGAGGFGYDPVFRPVGYDVSMAELPTETKNRISHRGLAFAALRAAITRATGR